MSGTTSVHPQAYEAFKEGLESTLRQWTALELAVLNKWGGENSAEKANELYMQLLNIFTTSSVRIFKDDVIIFVEDFMELHFNTICEDDSPTELGELLACMWNQCVTGDFTLVTNALAREYARSEIINQCQGIDQSGDDDMSDEDSCIEHSTEESEPSNTFSSSSSGHILPHTNNTHSSVTLTSHPAECMCAHMEADDRDDETPAVGADSWQTAGAKKQNRNKKNGRK